MDDLGNAERRKSSVRWQPIFHVLGHHRSLNDDLHDNVALGQALDPNLLLTLGLIAG